MNQSAVKNLLKHIKQYETPVSLFFGALAISSSVILLLSYAKPYLMNTQWINRVERAVLSIQLPKISTPTFSFPHRLPSLPDATSTTIEEEVPTPVVRTHTTTPTDTLWKLAQKYYNDGYKWTKIYEANKRKIPNPNVLDKGIDLVIPE